MVKVSIIMPVYNAEKYLRQCLDSLVNQTYGNKIIYLIDDGSSDTSGLICDEYAENNSYVKVVHIKNSGVSVARNTALDRIKEGYVTFADADDAVDLQAYEILIKGLESTHSDLAACNLKNEYKAFQVIEKNIEIDKLCTYEKDELVTAFFNQIGGWAWNKVFRREIIGEVRFRKNIFQTEDMLFFWEIIKKAKRVCFIDFPFYHYRFYLSSLSRGGNIEKLKTAISAQDFIKHDLDAINANDLVIKKWAHNYIVWNLKICESMSNMKQPDIDSYIFVRNNISRYKQYISSMSKRYQILANSALKSWQAYKTRGKIFYLLKKLYVKIQNGKQGMG